MQPQHKAPEGTQCRSVFSVEERPADDSALEVLHTQILEYYPDWNKIDWKEIDSRFNAARLHYHRAAAGSA
jgi:hypothetical protein